MVHKHPVSWQRRPWSDCADVQMCMPAWAFVSGVGVRVTSYIWHITDVRTEWPPFSALPGIWLAPFFQQKVYEWPDFSGFLCERPHFPNILVFSQIFRLEIFRGSLSCWYYIIDCDICLTTSKKWVQKNQKGNIWIGQHFGWSSIWMGPFFQRPGIWMG